jgi:hypothetical protein
MEDYSEDSKEGWYIKSRLDYQLAYYSNKATSYKKYYNWLVAADIIISALISFTALFSTYYFTKYVIALMGVSVTVISGFLSTFQFDKKWIEYRTTAETLKHEKYAYEMGIEPYDQENKISVLVNNIETLISKENTNWAYYIQRKNKLRRKDDKNE